MFRRVSRVSYRPEVMLGNSVFKTTQVLANLDPLRRAYKSGLQRKVCMLEMFWFLSTFLICRLD